MKSKRRNKFCECGCGEIVKPGNRFINGHNKRSMSKEERKKRSIAMKGKNNPFYGKSHSKETKERISKANSGNIPWNKGKTGIYSEEYKKKISKANKGKKLSEETKKKISFSTSISKLKELTSRGYCSAFKDNDYKRSIRKSGCERCGISKGMSYKLFGMNLSLHHLDEDKLNSHPNNMMTVCFSCHPKEHYRLRKNKR